jgi:hypothetical protein
MKNFQKKPTPKQNAKKPPSANNPAASIITKEHWESYSKELKDDFVPKPSARTRNVKEFWQRDGDQWIEIKVFTGRVKSRTKEQVYRSLFYSVKMSIAYWDEPPTGAETVIWMNKGSSKKRAPAAAAAPKRAPTVALEGVPSEKRLFTI